MIEGGWDYVAAAYSITYATLFFYSVSVWRRARQSECVKNKAARQPR